jgi:hypothetical protein
MTMTRSVPAVTLAIALMSTALPHAPAAAQAPAVPELRNPRLITDYVEPRSEEFEDLYQRLKKRQVLEELAQFLSPLKLPKTLRLTFAECGMVNADYDPLGLRIRICYEWVDFMEKRAPRTASPALGVISRSDAIVGSTVSVIFHEIGHALFDILQLPVLGKEEDGADQLAGFIMLQFGKDVARTTINGTAFTWATLASGNRRPDFSDVHSTAEQRIYNYACIAYGGDPETFKDYIDKGLLPKSRAENCKKEYEQIKLAFTKTILPYVDLEMMKKVQALRWLRPTDGN